MKRIVVILMLLVVAAGCSKPVEDNIYCDVTLRLSLPGGKEVASMTVNPALRGNMFKNINTGINYPYPEFVGDVCKMTVQKGVYMIAFDGDVVYSDGTSGLVRFTGYNSLSNVRNLLEDEETVELSVIVLR